MILNRCFRLCNGCCRVVYSGRKRDWRTLTGYRTAKHANTTVVGLGATVVARRHFHSDLGDLHNNECVQKYLQQLMEEYRDLGRKLQLDHLSESDRKVLLRRQTELLPVAIRFESVQQALKDQEEVTSLLHSA